MLISYSFYVSNKANPPTRFVTPVSGRIWSLSELDNHPGASPPLRGRGLKTRKPSDVSPAILIRAQANTPTFREVFPEIGFHILPADPGYRAKARAAFLNFTCTCHARGEHSTQTSAERCAFRLFLFKLVSGAFPLLCSAAVFDRLMLIMSWSMAIWLVLTRRTIAYFGAVVS